MHEQTGGSTGPRRVYVYSLLVPFPLGFIGTLLIAQPLGDYAALLALGVGVVAQVAAIGMTLHRSSKSKATPESGSLGP